MGACVFLGMWQPCYPIRVDIFPGFEQGGQSICIPYIAILRHFLLLWLLMQPLGCWFVGIGPKSPTNTPRRIWHLFWEGNLLGGGRLGLKVLFPLPVRLSWKFDSRVFGQLCYDFSSSDICTCIALDGPSPHSQPLKGIDIKNNGPRKDAEFWTVWDSANQTPVILEFVNISVIGRGDGQLRCLESELEGIYAVGFSSRLISWGEILRHWDRQMIT